MSFKIRLEKLLRLYNLNPKKLGEMLGYGSNPAKLYRLLNDENNSPSVQIVQDLLNAFPNINARWLIAGDKDMIVEEDSVKYGFCKECIKKEGEIARLEKECAKKDKRIEELLVALHSLGGEDQLLGKKAR